MSKKQNLWIIIALLCFLGVILLFFKGLGNNPQELDNVSVGKSTEQLQFNLPNLFTKEAITPADLPNPPYLLNVWGSWCPACYEEHPYLMHLKNEINIVGLNWPANNPNEEENALKFLRDLGNPYQITIMDEQGFLIIDLGVYGAPETFLIGENHTILQRHAGPLNPKVWQEKFIPYLKNTP